MFGWLDVVQKDYETLKCVGKIKARSDDVIATYLDDSSSLETPIGQSPNRDNLCPSDTPTVMFFEFLG